MRSDGQFNTTIYSNDDRFRGVHGSRMVLFMNAADMERYGLGEGDVVALRTHADDGVDRRVEGLRSCPTMCRPAASPATTRNAIR